MPLSQPIIPAIARTGSGRAPTSINQVPERELWNRFQRCSIRGNAYCGSAVAVRFVRTGRHAVWSQPQCFTARKWRQLPRSRKPQMTGSSGLTP